MLYIMTSGDRYTPEMLSPGDVLLFQRERYDWCEYFTRFKLPNGKFLLETWGAGNGYNGRGGYSRGVLDLSLAEGETPYNTDMFAVVGGVPYPIATGNYNPEKDTTAHPERTYNYCTNIPGANGGGIGARWSYNNSVGDYSYGGGGATDFRIISPDIDHRIIVAGGAGGYTRNQVNAGVKYLSDCKGEDNYWYRYSDGASSGLYSSSMTGKAGFYGVAVHHTHGTGSTPYQVESGQGPVNPPQGSGWITYNYNNGCGGSGGGFYNGGQNGRYSDTSCNDCDSGAPGCCFVWRSGQQSLVPSSYAVPQKYWMKNASILSGSGSMPDPYYGIYSNKTSATQSTGNLYAGVAKVTVLDVDAGVYLYTKINDAWVRTNQLDSDKMY